MVNVKRAPVTPRLVHEVSAVCAGVAASDREAETATDVGRLGARETFEQAEAELLGHALAAVLDGDLELSASCQGRQRDRLRAVAHGVAEQVGDDAVEHERSAKTARSSGTSHPDACAGRHRFGGDLRQDASRARAAPGLTLIPRASRRERSSSSSSSRRRRSPCSTPTRNSSLRKLPSQLVASRSSKVVRTP